MRALVRWWRHRTTRLDRQVWAAAFAQAHVQLRAEGVPAQDLAWRAAGEANLVVMSLRLGRMERRDLTQTID